MTLPANIFFRPTKAFLSWIKDYAGDRLVIDCGAGQGWLTKKLLDIKVPTLALDKNERDKTYAPVVQCDCEQFKFPRNSLPIFARPCHGPWVMETIKSSMYDWGTANVKECLYISNKKNLTVDLDDEDKGIKIGRIFTNAGRDRESVWSVSRTMTDAKETWVLLKTPHWQSWVEDDGGKFWINIAGGKVPKSKSDRVLKRQVVGTYRDLDWFDEMDLPGSDSGWLAPDGTFCPCASCAHDRYADLVLHSTPDALDKLNWIRVYNAPGKGAAWSGGRDWICITHHPTEWQILWLEERGHVIEKWDREE